jgi:hypothetical protein
VESIAGGVENRKSEVRSQERDSAVDHIAEVKYAFDMAGDIPSCDAVDFEAFWLLSPSFLTGLFTASRMPGGNLPVLSCATIRLDTRGPLFFDDGCGLHVVEFRETLFQVRIALRLNETLAWACSTGRAFTVIGIEGIHNAHAFNDLTEWRKAL